MFQNFDFTLCKWLDFDQNCRLPSGCGSCGSIEHRRCIFMRAKPQRAPRLRCAVQAAQCVHIAGIGHHHSAARSLLLLLHIVGQDSRTLNRVRIFSKHTIYQRFGGRARSLYGSSSPAHRLPAVANYYRTTLILFSSFSCDPFPSRSSV